MKGRIKLMLIAILCFAQHSCNKTLTPAEYIHYVESETNGLKRTIAIGQWNFIFQYRPHEYIILFEQGRNLNAKKVQERLRELRGTIWFNIRIQRTDHSVSPLRYNLTSRQEYQDRLKYFLNYASNDISLKYGKEKLPLAAYHFETNYNLTPQETFVVGFRMREEKLPSSDMQISIHDKIFKNGIIKATVMKKDIVNIPKVKIESL